MDSDSSDDTGNRRIYDIGFGAYLRCGIFGGGRAFLRI